MVEGGDCIGVLWCVDVLYRGGRCGFKCLEKVARLGVVELIVVCSCSCVTVCCVDIHWGMLCVVEITLVCLCL